MVVGQRGIKSINTQAASNCGETEDKLANFLWGLLHMWLPRSGALTLPGSGARQRILISFFLSFFIWLRQVLVAA